MLSFCVLSLCMQVKEAPKDKKKKKKKVKEEKEPVSFSLDREQTVKVFPK
jgi:hypothetical protein